MSVMEPNGMADLVGPFYEANEVASRLGCGAADLAERERAGGLLALRTSDGLPVYPVFQFTENGDVRPELVPVLTMFTGVPAWSVAVWLRTPNADLDEHSPEQALADGHDPELVRTLAGQWAGVLSA